MTDKRIWIESNGVPRELTGELGDMVREVVRWQGEEWDGPFLGRRNDKGAWDTFDETAIRRMLRWARLGTPESLRGMKTEARGRVQVADPYVLDLESIASRHRMRVERQSNERSCLIGENGRILDERTKVTLGGESDEQNVEAMVGICRAKGWDRVRVRGDEQFLRLSRGAAAREGIEIVEALVTSEPGSEKSVEAVIGKGGDPEIPPGTASRPRGASVERETAATDPSAGPPKKVLTWNQYLKVLDELAAETRPEAKRNCAMLHLFGGEHGVKLKELIELQISDLNLDRGTLKVGGREVSLSGGCSRALHEWISIRGDQPGPLFVNFDKKQQITSEPMKEQAIINIAKRLGLGHPNGLAKISAPAADVGGKPTVAGPPSEITLDEARQLKEEWLAAQRSDVTRRDYNKKLSTLAKAADIPEDEMVRRIASNGAGVLVELQSRLESAGRTKSTIQHYASVVVSIHNHARESGKASDAPLKMSDNFWVREMPRRNTTPTTIDYYESVCARLSRLDGKASVRNLAMLRLMGTEGMGLRVGEALNVRREDVDLAHSVITYRAKSRDVPVTKVLGEKAQRAVERWIEIRGDEPGPLFVGLGMSSGKLGRSRIAQIVEREGLGTPHMLRHLMALEVWQRTNDIQAVMEAGGWSDERIAWWYLRMG